MQNKKLLCCSNNVRIFEATRDETRRYLQYSIIRTAVVEHEWEVAKTGVGNAVTGEVEHGEVLQSAQCCRQSTDAHVTETIAWNIVWLPAELHQNKTITDSLQISFRRTNSITEMYWHLKERPPETDPRRNQPANMSSLSVDWHWSALAMGRKCVGRSARLARNRTQVLSELSSRHRTLPYVAEQRTKSKVKFAAIWSFGTCDHNIGELLVQLGKQRTGIDN